MRLASVLALMLMSGAAVADDLDALIEGNSGPGYELGGAWVSNIAGVDGDVLNGGIATTYGRLEYTRKIGQSLQFVNHSQVDLRAASNEPLFALANASPRIVDRAVDLTTTITDDDQATLDATADWLYLTGSWRSGNYSIGRFPVTMTFGKVWSPTDNYAPFAFFDLDRLYKRGVDAVQFDWYANNGWSFLSIASAAKRSSSSPRLNALQSIRWTGDNSKLMFNVSDRVDQQFWSISAQRNGLLFGGDVYLEYLQGDLADNEQALWQDDENTRMLIGTTQKVAANTLMTFELFYQSLGAGSVEELDQVLANQQQTGLSDMGAGRYYAAASISGQITPLLTHEMLLLGNLKDESTLLSALFKYSVSNNLEARMAFAVPLETGEETAEFNRQPRVLQLGLNYYF